MNEDKVAEAALRRQQRRVEPKVKVQLLANISGTGRYMKIVEVSLSRAFMYVEHDPPWARWPEGYPIPKRPGHSISKSDLPPRRSEVLEVFDPNMEPVDE